MIGRQSLRGRCSATCDHQRVVVDGGDESAAGTADVTLIAGVVRLLADEDLDDRALLQPESAFHDDAVATYATDPLTTGRGCEENRGE